MVTLEERARWEGEGYLVREGLVGPVRCDELLGAADLAVRKLAEEEFDGEGRLPAGLLERYQLSAAGMMVFWDPDLGDPGDADGERRAGMYARLGHCIHRVEPVFGEFVDRGPLAEVAAELNGASVEAVQSLVMAKQVGSRVRFEYHHDGAYIRTDPDTLVVAWLALDDADDTNGGLRLLPGSHHTPHDPEAHGPPAPLDSGVSIPLKRGSAAFWRGGMLHASDLNLSSGPRRGLIAYYVADGASTIVEPCRPR